MIRTVRPNQSAKDFLDRLQHRDGEMEISIFFVQSKVRGSRQYFHALVGKVKPMIEREGPPALFITASCVEWYSPEFIKHLRDSTVMGSSSIK